MEAEIGVMQLQAKEHQGLPATTRSSERGLEHIVPQSSQKEATLPKPWVLDFWPPEL